MKRNLLLSSLSFVALGVMAQPFMQNDAPVAFEMSVPESKFADVSIKSVKLMPTSEVSSVNSRADVEVYPYYYAPDGSFYRGFIADNRYPLSQPTSELNDLRVPGGVPLTWKGASYASGVTDPQTVQWNYFDIDWAAQAYVEKTATSANLVTPAIPVGYSIPKSPTLTIGERSIGGDCKVVNLGVSNLTFTGMGELPMAYYPFNIRKIANQDLVVNSDSIDIDRFANCSIGTGLLQPGITVKSTGFIARKPASMYGITGITFLGLINAYESPRMEFNVYRLLVDNNGDMQLGERLGGGYIDKENIPVSSTSFVAFTIPVIDVDGDLSVESFLNIDDQIVVLLSGWETRIVGQSFAGDVVAPLVTLGAVESLRKYGHGVYVDGNDKLTPWSQWSISPTGIITDPFFGVLLYNGNLVVADDNATETYEYQAPVNGGSYTFTFTPTSDLAGDMVKIEGNGLFEWYDYEVGDRDNNGNQTITVNVDKLEGTAGRYSLLKVAIPGAEQIIKIKQGELSGIGSVEADADVVASEYFDMMGRKLNAEPQSGLFIRKDLKADGTTVATKLAK